MAKNINIREIGEYFTNVVSRSNHHANSVKHSIYYLLGVILQFCDDEVQVKTYNGALVNVIWFYIKGRRYCLSYNHDRQIIELRDKTCRGACLLQCDDNTELDDIVSAFQALSDTK